MKFKDGQFYTTSQISPRMEKTPEGFLLCKGVPISRTGSFEYRNFESGLDGDPMQKRSIERTETELFSPETIKSFEGKSVIVEHTDFVNPSNWKDLSVGIVQNVRRGEGDAASQLLADLLLTDSRGIELVESKKLREVSCGYDSLVVCDDSSGKYYQTQIVGNHVALVKQGRCGKPCQIKDGHMSNFKTLLRRLFKDGDEEKFNEALDGVEIAAKETTDEEPEGETHEAPSIEDRLKGLEAQYSALSEKLGEAIKAIEALTAPKETTDEEPAPEEVPEKDEEPEAEDKTATPEEVKEVFDSAEELCNGIKKPTADSKDGAITYGALERLKRSAIKGAGIKAFGDSASLSGKELDIAFKGALEIVRASKNPKANFADGKAGHSGDSRYSNAQLNDRFRDFWKGV